MYPEQYNKETRYEVHNQSVTNVYYCLNPLCKAKSVRFGAKDVYRHRYCLKWVISESYRRVLCEEPGKGLIDLSKQHFDFFYSPLSSAITMKHALQQINWYSELKHWYNLIQAYLQYSLSKLFYQAHQSLTKLSNTSYYVYQLLQQYSYDSCSDNTYIQHKDNTYSNHNNKYYSKQRLVYGLYRLLEVEYFGKVEIFRKDKLGAKIKYLDYELQKCSRYFCQVYDPNSVRNRHYYYKKLMKISEVLTSENELSSKLQKVLSCFGKSSITYDKNNSYECWLCNTIITGQGANKKYQKLDCQNNILTHLIHNHQTITKYSYARKFYNYNIFPITFSYFSRYLTYEHYHTCVIIDRENIKCEVVGEFGMYVIEVVAKHNTNIAKGKYLIAESQGKDASDILIIVALTKLLYLRYDKAILITKDHYGYTLQPIFASLGLNIIIKNSYDTK